MKCNLKAIALVCLGVSFYHSSWAQLASSAEGIRERYAKRAEKADRIKEEFTAKIHKDYETEVKAAQEELKRTFDAAIRVAAVRGQTEEVRQLTLQKEALLGEQTGSSSSAMASTATAGGSDYKDLLGTWATPSGSSFRYIFEFKGNKDVNYTYEYTSNSGASKNIAEYRASQKDGRIVITSSRESNTRWEVTLPFDPSDLKITRYYEGNNGSNSFTYKLTRQP